MKKYTIQGIEYSEEQVKDWFNCKFCGANVSNVDVYMHEDASGEHFCEGSECVYLHVAECDTVEVEGITDEGEEE